MQSVHRRVETKSRKICSVPQCSSYCTKNVSLHYFPKDPKLSKIWQTTLKIGKPVTKYMLVCSQHFVAEDFTPATNIKKRLKKLAIPTQKIPTTKFSSKKVQINRSDRHWLQKCTLNEESGDTDGQEDVPDIHVGVPQAHFERPGTSNYIPLTHVALLENIFYEDKATETQSTDFFQLPQILNTDEKLISFTGVNFDILNTITRCAEKTATFNDGNWPDMNVRIILVLCKLKLNISFACLSILFKLSKTQCTSIFYSTTTLLAVALKPAIYWPNKEQILNNMPKCFEKFKNTRIVLDCIEIKIHKLKCLKCRVKSYSHYKGTHTLKYLIGITPSGLISFVSAGFGGRATDKSIFNYENIIDKLEVHDAVMVDKGFLIQQECDEKLVKLIRPPFLKKQKQLSKEDAEATADIARARVHVERAIQRVKIFKILHEQLNWFLIPYADEMMTIIAAIVNLSPPILADDKII